MTHALRYDARISRALQLLLGIAVTLVLRGYQFGGGNHCVYLIAPLREVDPSLLAHDWWTTHTLQYHLAFTHLSAALMRLGVIETAFLAFYLALVVLLHVAWRRVVLALGLDARAYLLSVMLYYLSAGGTGLGSYQFLQDSSFLPGNVSNVAMLWGLVLWIEGRAFRSAIALGIAALFHLNHAIVALAFFPIACLFRERPRLSDRALFGFAILVLFALPNLLPAAKLALSRAPRMPLPEFVDLYVHLRHPHHYDPLSWPIALWLSFLWPIPLAWLAYRRARTSVDPASGARRSALFVTVFFLALQVIPLLFAGIVFISEPLIQTSLFRFSIYPKLLTCVGAAAFLLSVPAPARRAARWALMAVPLLAIASILIIRLAKPDSTAGGFVTANLAPLLLFVGILAAGMIYLFGPSSSAPWPNVILVTSVVVALGVGWNRWLGLHIALDAADDANYLALCRHARDHTPKGAVFLVPPNEQLFRYHARRAIVVNFKNVPQLSIEMTEWRERLEAVIGTPLSTLPKRFDLAHAAIALAYDDRPVDALIAVAKHYDARYVITTRPQPTLHPVFENGSYHLYDLANSGKE